MKWKISPADFRVTECYDLEKLGEKDEGKGEQYHYFLLTKQDYTTTKAIQKIASFFRTSIKAVHSAGNKDRTAITKQIVSIRERNQKKILEKMEEFNKAFSDMSLEYLGVFTSRINLGDNEGNAFELTLRDIDEEEFVRAQENLKTISEWGVLNYFDSQRYGYAGNTHIIGKYLLQGNMEKALFEILTATPPHPNPKLKESSEYIAQHWKTILEKGGEEEKRKAKELLGECGKRDEVAILAHLEKNPPDLYGAFRNLPKKIRTLYLHAYQSSIFDALLKKLSQEHNVQNYKTLPLVHAYLNTDKEVQDIIENLLEKDELALHKFALSAMPELQADSVQRETRIFPKNLVLGEKEEDEEHTGKYKVKLSFELPPGSYATQVVRQLFG
ncbi:tRNA pseudouridine(13) synthase TruD [Candidatus Woesearchaeota archaeon]|nr:tRNA pseudouridine(13) synthase TruD [Nanoarchaeota archaeon]MCB9370058.1 tRNA pseudouridine(13) synthase TruD [Candidatus Woesearchaeota archaeon]USN44588.1 MAG: tRNA pseudouridine(13) synthase TruD [Candidatus Woesearchaeota archaeon]